MSTKTTEKSKRGGKRERAGRPKGSGKKTKICVSVDSKIWNAAVRHWTENPLRKPSWLVDGLISDYVKTIGSLPTTKAAI
jgi:hypothetical protein